MFSFSAMKEETKAGILLDNSSSKEKNNE